MTVELERYWERAVGFDEWLERAEQNAELWRGIYDRARVPEELMDAVDGLYRLLVLAEDWCGDAVNTVPWLARLADEVEGLELRLLRRDEHPALMREYTTNGSHSIPVVIVLDEDWRELGWWGPRPAELQAWVLEEGLGMPREDRYKRVRTWYARDRGRTTLTELLELITSAERVPSLQGPGTG